MKRVHKYVINPSTKEFEPLTSAWMPAGAKVLTAAIHPEGLCVWAEIDEEVKMKNRRDFAVVGTGWKFDGGTYIASVYSGLLVFHVYEIGSNSSGVVVE